MTLRRALYAALALLVAGHAWDWIYHARNEGLEAGADMIVAHGLLYLGAIAAVVTGVAARWRGAFALALVGGVVALGGHAWDYAIHSGGEDSRLPHLLFALGEALVAAAALYPAFFAPREEREGA